MIPEMSRLNLVRSLSSLYYQIDSPKKTESASSTTRSNQISPRHDVKADRWHYSPDNYSNQTKTNFFKKKKGGESPSASQFLTIGNSPQKSNTRHTQDSCSSKEKLKDMKQPVASHNSTKNADSREQIIKHIAINASKKSLNPQRAFAISSEFQNHYKRTGSNLSSEKKGQNSKFQEKNKYSYKIAFSNPYQIRKSPSKSLNDTTKQEKKYSKRRQTDKINHTKKSYTLQAKDKDKIQRQKSLIRQQRMKKDMQKIIQQQKDQIDFLKQMLRSSRRQNIQMQIFITQLQQQLSYYSQLWASAIKKNELQAQLAQLQLKQAQEQKENQTRMLRNKQLQAVIANMQEDKERYSLQLKKEYVLLADRLKQRESIIQHLQMSNNLLREQYAQLHINVQRITEERARYLSQQLEQQSFSWEQNQKHYLTSSIK